MKHGLKRVLLLPACLLLTAGLQSGCGQRAAEASKAEKPVFSRPEVMLLVATERNRYEQIYTDQIWNVRMPEDGKDFEEYLLEQIRLFATDVKVIGQMAEEYGISLDSSEKEQLRRLSQDYYSQLSAGDRAYTGADQEDVLRFYQEYHLAGKTVEELTKGDDLEISDSEAKVIDVKQIVLEEPETAQEVSEQVGAEGVDFETIARAYSVEPDISCQIGRGEHGPAFDAEIFALEEGEISRPVEEEGRYYIIQCVNSYNQEATLVRKEELSLLRKDKAFRTIYNEFLEKHPLNLSDEVWGEIRCVTDEDTTTTNLFELYKEYFPE